MEGAVYTVYLKKVRYHTPSRAASSDDEDSISHLEWETVRIRFVKVSQKIGSCPHLESFKLCR
jgi:ral guanine nucleotide dissociation stimulator-like 1